MLLRRVTQHIQNQNWFAVFIDFLIVVVGVFIGIQVANWSALQSDLAEYERALERLNIEISENISILDTIDPEINQSLTNLEVAFDALKSCVDSEENKRAINQGISELRGTYGLHLRSDALDELTSSPRLLALQSKKIKKRLSDMSFQFNVINKDSDFLENHPLEGRFENNPIIGVGNLKLNNIIYYGVDYSQKSRQLYLKVPVDEACKNNQLLKSFYTWEAWQDTIPIFSRQIRKELQLTQDVLNSHKSSLK